MPKSKLLEFTKKGIYCALANIYIDPWQPVDSALITHGHADHARFGHKKYLCHPLTACVIKQRISPELNIQTIPYSEKIKINGVNFSFHPAGHILGSSQIRVEYKGEVWVVSGDYKTENDLLSTPLEIVQCNTFITECTFGLPVYQWPKQKIVFDEINHWWNMNKRNDKISIIYAYSLGKAQRIIQGLEETIGPILTHKAVENVNTALRNVNINLKKTNPIDTQTILKNELSGAIIIAPPSSQNSSWIGKLKRTSHAQANGWMTIRGARRRKSLDRGFILSDHADWDGLNQVIKASGAENVITTHGYTATFTKWLVSEGLNAITEETAFDAENIDNENPVSA